MHVKLKKKKKANWWDCFTNRWWGFFNQKEGSFEKLFAFIALDQVVNDYTIITVRPSLACSTAAGVRGKCSVCFVYVRVWEREGLVNYVSRGMIGPSVIHCLSIECDCGTQLGWTVILIHHPKKYECMWQGYFTVLLRLIWWYCSHTSMLQQEEVKN